ncbi:WG repeat-containing protein [Flavobacterium procerum]|uniref:WG repeat-containing protein n=1 Tax=Flavobacterium procerum TaxID=1455569 RepID=A0ABV6BNY1_9FLAO
MKIVFSLLFPLMHLVGNAQNDPELFPVNDKKVGYLGYYLEDMTNVVAPQFCSATYSVDGYYIVSKGEHEYYENGRRKEEHIPNTEKFGLLNSKGQFIIDFKNDYDGIYVSKGIIYIIKNNLYGTVNEQNEIVIPIEYEELNIEDKNVIIAKKNSKYGVLNSLGETIIPFEFEDLNVDEDKIKAVKNKIEYYYTLNGTFIKSKNGNNTKKLK